MEYEKERFYLLTSAPYRDPGIASKWKQNQSVTFHRASLSFSISFNIDGSGMTAAFSSLVLPAQTTLLFHLYLSTRTRTYVPLCTHSCIHTCTHVRMQDCMTRARDRVRE